MTADRDAAGTELDPATLYALLRLRTDVFVVEQRCPYPELDGRDLDASTRHFWREEGGAVVACLRLLDQSDGSRIGRVATAAGARGRGHAGALLRRALAVAARPVVLDAQAHLVQLYARFGFTVAGPGFVEDGIPHVPMRLA